MASLNVAPVTIFNGLVQEVADYVWNRRVVNEFSLRQLKLRAEDLVKADVAQGLEVKAHISFLEGRFNDGVSLFDRAIGLSPRKAGVVVRYIQLADQIVMRDQLAYICENYIDILGGAVSEKREAITCLRASGFIHAAASLKRDLKRMGIQDVQDAYPSEDFIAHFDRSRVTDLEVSEVICFARSFLRSRRVDVDHVSVLPMPGSGNEGASLHYDFGVKALPAEVVELEWDLFSELGSKMFPVEQSGILSLSLSPSEE